MRRVPWGLAALPALALARLLPAYGVGLGLRLGAATAVLLVPGGLAARALGQEGLAAPAAWSLAALALALGAVFVVHTGIWLALAVLVALSAAVLPVALRRTPRGRIPGAALVLFAGIVFGIALWHVSGVLGGDALFHLARVRKLDALGGLHLRTLDEFRDGGLHPGYAFPLWHGFLALVARTAGVDPASVVLHEATVLAPLAFLLVYEAGLRVFESVAGAIATLLAQVALVGLAAGHGGAYVSLALPPTADRQLFVPAAIALFFAYAAEPSRGRLAVLAAASLALVLVHATYAVFLCIPLAGYVAVRSLAERRDALPGLRALTALAAPAAIVLVPLHSLASRTASYTPSRDELRRALRQYAGELDVSSLHRYRLAPEVFGRTGAVAVTALLSIPLAGFAWRRRWAAWVLGGSLALFALTLPSFVFPHFADVVSLSQARRAAGFVPFAFAFAGGALVGASVLRALLLPVALASGVALQLAYPGDFGYGLRNGGPAAVTWIAAAGAVAAIAAAALGRRVLPERRSTLAALAAVLFVAPVGVHALAHWSALRGDDARALTPGLVAALRETVPKRDVVFSDLPTSYRIAAAAPVYVAAAPPEHVADTRANRPYRRAKDAQRFFRKGNLAIPRRYGARWIVLVRARYKLTLPLRAVYADRRYVLYRLAAPSADLALVPAPSPFATTPVGAAGRPAAWRSREAISAISSGA